jgi:hypothetical protein
MTKIKHGRDYLSRFSTVTMHVRLPMRWRMKWCSPSANYGNRDVSLSVRFYDRIFIYGVRGSLDDNAISYVKNFEMALSMN